MHPRRFFIGKVIGFFVIFVLIAVIGFLTAQEYLNPADESGETQSSAPLPASVLIANAYPLYGGVQWGSVQAENFVIGTTSYSGTSITSGLVPAGMDPANVFTPFENYYASKLQAVGWEIANDLAAGGHTGGQTGYRKGGAVILTRFNINYHTKSADAPSECPCDVTLSLWSGK